MQPPVSHQSLRLRYFFLVWCCSSLLSHTSVHVSCHFFPQVNWLCCGLRQKSPPPSPHASPFKDSTIQEILADSSTLHPIFVFFVFSPSVSHNLFFHEVTSSLLRRVFKKSFHSLCTYPHVGISTLLILIRLFFNWLVICWPLLDFGNHLDEEWRANFFGGRYQRVCQNEKRMQDEWQARPATM